jgi:RNA polymerase sigma-70 factor (ECF subfamily)
MDNVDAVVLEVRAGNRERYRAIVEIFEVPVRLVVGAIVPDATATEDLVHEVFFTAFLKLADYQTGTDFRAWIKAFARNLALNERRRWHKQRLHSSRFEVDVEEAASNDIDQFTSLVDGETARHLRDCVAGLGDAARRVIDAFYFQGLPGDEIARAEKRRESWVHLVLFRARAAIAACLKHKGVVSHG